jgi:hypothetical protein
MLHTTYKSFLESTTNNLTNLGDFASKYPALVKYIQRLETAGSINDTINFIVDEIISTMDHVTISNADDVVSRLGWDTDSIPVIGTPEFAEAEKDEDFNALVDVMYAGGQGHLLFEIENAPAGATTIGNKAKEVAAKIINQFNNSEYGQSILNRARRNFPRWNENGQQTDEAVDYVEDQIFRIVTGFITVTNYNPVIVLTDDEYNSEATGTSIKEEVKDAVYAMLT